MAATTIKLPRQVINLRRPGEIGEAEEIDEEAFELEEQHRELESLTSQIALLEVELQTAREESFNQGFQDGLAAEREQHKQKIEAYAQQFSDLSARLQAEFSEVLKSMEEPLLRMSFDIAGKILKVTIPEDLKTEGLMETLHSFLNEVLHSESVVIRISAANFALMQSGETTENLAQSYPGAMKFVSDPLLGPGECLVETREHVIDGTYDHQLANLERNLR